MHLEVVGECFFFFFSKHQVNGVDLRFNLNSGSVDVMFVGETYQWAIFFSSLKE